MQIHKKHESVFGMTQSGKTHYAIEKCKQFEGGVLFFNPQEVKTGFSRINGNYELTQIVELLKKGRKLDYIPNMKKEIALKELEMVSYAMLQAHINGGMKETILAVDECHVFARSGSKNPLEDVATRGLGKGLYGLFITQRPQLVSNTLFSMSDVKTYFRLEDEEIAYYERAGTPMADLQQQIQTAGDYHFIQKYKGEYSSPMKI